MALHCWDWRSRTRPARFTGDNQTNIIDGTAVIWPGYYHVGPTNVSDALFILNGGSLANLGATIGDMPGGNSNLVVVSGTGSAWTNSGGDFYVGYYGSANRLVISDGGVVLARSLNALVGARVGSLYNSVLVTDLGSVWTNSTGLWIGDGGAYCSLVISNGGAVFSRDGFVGGGQGGESNIAIVTGTGSVWRSTSLAIGDRGNGNMLVVSNGGSVFNTDGHIGYTVRGQDNRVLVSGKGSLWMNSGALYFNRLAATPSSVPADGNRLTIADAGSVLASNVYLGFSPLANNCLLTVSGGNLIVTNLSGTGTIDVRRGRLAFSGGTITAERLWLTNGSDSIFEFNSGTLHSAGTVVSNEQPFVVGDGVASGNFHLLGGLHAFQTELRIRSNSILTGCGAVNGSVVVDAGGAVHVTCTNLVFNSAVTNNGTMVVDGGVLEAYVAFVNNGRILLLNGGTKNFHGTFINSGQILNGDTYLGIKRDGSGGFFIRYTAVPTVTYRLQRADVLTGPWSDIATNTAASGLVEYYETSPPAGQAFYRAIQP